jgi:sec-independent protein translocase protein TatB
MFLGLTWEKILILLVIAAFLIGPERLPRYAEGLATLVKRGREMLRGARERMRDEMGSDFDDVDWRKLDPRQYDPRRIIREALLDDAPVAGVRAATLGAAAAATSTTPEPRAAFSSENPPPYDNEAT